jgi:ATP-dependent Clp protease ATP-binding subunit ClpA
MNPQPGRVIKIVKRESHEEVVKNPYLLVMLAITIAGAIFGLNNVSHNFAPLFLVAALAGMAWLAWQQTRTEQAEGNELDYTKLAAIDLNSYAPWLKENLRGQDETIDTILAELQSNLSLATSGRTLGSFFLVGPTGTGKTFLGQLIAETLYPESEPLILRMNQYKHADDVFTLIGPPPGSPGYEVGGTLTRPVLENPRRVIILDELEKSHRDLQHCLYDILDTATCREKSSGRTVDFSGCVFFATCNAGVEGLRAIRRESGNDPVTWLGRSREVLMDAASFDRAFLARWSAILFMDELSPLHVAEVACLQLARHWRTYGIEVRHAAPELILDAVQRNEEFRQYGVRQLGTYIQKKTSAAIGQARARGVKKVDLNVGPNGALEISSAGD